MRKKITKEIVFTNITCGQLDFVDGKPVAVELPTERLLGSITKEKAQKMMNRYDKHITVFEVNPETVVYEMDIEVFMKHATVKEVETSD